ncbi:hypothetical protein IG193_04750 [Infirmifilum lucidum]|uniref:Uncharacterized protein n=1 Tax=Infirmifilum lucidum TaxID=2776706 RepID=A0A7L9FEP7_9CREN|nr:hypothetical protein [Infirmifilum lucidum]QOJ78101.1 hypothetical protein IG193_04750 [Infirmifilum lucidum]
MPVRYLGRGIEDTVREGLRKFLADDPGTLKLALELLEVYAREGRNGVRKLIQELVEAGNIGSEAAEA